MAYRIHIFGASGSGTTTLGRALSRRLDVLLLDADDFYWKPTDPPFREKRPPAERIDLIEKEIGDRQSWILTGSICNWGDPLVQRLTLAVFLRLDLSIRMERLRARERLRYGSRIGPDGDMHETHRKFMDWAASYETAVAPVRSLDLHERWITQLKCPILRLNSDVPTTDLVEKVASTLVAGA